MTEAFRFQYPVGPQRLALGEGDNPLRPGLLVHPTVATHVREGAILGSVVRRRIGVPARTPFPLELRGGAWRGGGAPGLGLGGRGRGLWRGAAAAAAAVGTHRCGLVWAMSV